MVPTVTPSNDVLSFGPFRLAPSERLLTKEGAPVELGARALDILIALGHKRKAPHKAWRARRIGVRAPSKPPRGGLFGGGLLSYGVETPDQCHPQPENRQGARPRRTIAILLR